MPVSEIITDKPVINISGCPPIPEAMAGTIAYLVTFGKLPDLDHLNRPKAFFGDSIHDRCYRRPFYDKGLFAKSFDDEGARKGWCLYEVGCKGPVTYNACATLKWNGGVSFPIQSGHGCLGCSEPNFWDKGGFYKPLSASTGGPRRDHRRRGGRGRGVGVASALLARRRKTEAAKEPQIMNLLDFARGPALEVAFAVFVFGVAWRLLSLLLLPGHGTDRSRGRTRRRRSSAPRKASCAICGRRGRSSRSALFVTVNGYVFHLGLAVIVFGFAQHILFLRGLFGVQWPSLPSGVISAVSVVTLASLLAALARRLTSPVLKLISTFNDYFSWFVTVLPVVTGLRRREPSVGAVRDAARHTHAQRRAAPDLVSVRQADARIPGVPDAKRDRDLL